MGEFASKGLANGLGIPALVLGGAAFAQNNGLLGGLFGGNNQASAVMAENAMLKAERHSDKADVEVYAQTRRENQDLGDRILGNWVKPIAQEAAANRERLATLEAKVDGNKALTDKDMIILRKDVEIAKLEGANRAAALDNKIDVVAITAKNGIAKNSEAIRALYEEVNGFTCHKVRKDAICPEVMERWNSWTSPEAVTAPATQPISGSINVM